MALRLVKASAEYENLIVNMLEEWIEYNNNHVSANHSPMAIFKNDYHDFTSYISNLDYIKAEEGKVPSSTFFCLDEERNIMIGAVNIRHYLNDSLLSVMESGHLKEEKDMPQR